MSSLNANEKELKKKKGQVKDTGKWEENWCEVPEKAGREETPQMGD